SRTGTSEFAASAANCKQRAMAALLVVRSSSFRIERRCCMVSEELLPHGFAQLSNRFKRILNERPSADNDARFSLHSDAQRQRWSCAWRNFVAVQRSQRDEVGPVRSCDSRGTDPIKFSAYSAVTLVWERFEK